MNFGLTLASNMFQPLSFGSLSQIPCVFNALLFRPKPSFWPRGQRWEETIAVSHAISTDVLHLPRIINCFYYIVC